MANKKPRNFSEVKGFDERGYVQIATRLRREDFELLVMAARAMDVSVSAAIRSVIAKWAERKSDHVRKIADGG